MQGENRMRQRRVALVTGASRGLGKVCAVELGRAGFQVAVTARTLSRADERSLPGNLESTVDAISATGAEGLAIKMDLDERSSVVTGIDAAMVKWGRIDVLVNNAFYQTRDSQYPLVNMSMEHLDKQIRVNLLAPMFLAKLVLPQMLERGEGAVINMVSGASVHQLNTPPGRREWGIGYGTSKTGMIEIAVMLASQYGDRGIRSFSVQPGTVLTEQIAAALEGGTFDSSDWTPAEHSALTIVWLATAPEAMELNGALISAPSFVHEKGLLSPAG
jgi:NAD(P)-dependent dehydrogenase (short-subunit alcohol dehydrogenase family)